MTALLRRHAAPALPAPRATARILDHWRQAVPIRREWLDAGLCTRPAERAEAESAIARIYRRHGRPTPRFRWVESPHEALPLLRGRPGHAELRRWIAARTPAGDPPLVSDLAAGLSRLRSALDAAADHPDLNAPPRRAKEKEKEKLPRLASLPPDEALDAGHPLREVLRHGVREALSASLAAGVSWPVRRALGAPDTVPVGWYGQHDVPWVAHYDALRRLGLAEYRAADETAFDDWVRLARSAGWWWPGEDLCVLAERPAAIEADPVRGSWHDEVLPRRVRFRDGWSPPLS